MILRLMKRFFRNKVCVLFIKQPPNGVSPKKIVIVSHLCKIAFVDCKIDNQ